MTTALAVFAGLTTATLLILAAGNSRPTPDPVMTGKPAVLQSHQATQAIGNGHGAAAHTTRSSVDLAANRLSDAELH